jgi:hypothetical protein
LAEHRFKIGQLVYFKPEKLERAAHDLGPGPYQIIKRLPATQDGEFQYTVRSSSKSRSNRARERIDACPKAVPMNIGQN